jgi:hypothetical protein
LLAQVWVVALPILTLVACELNREEFASYKRPNLTQIDCMARCQQPDAVSAICRLDLDAVEN